MGWISSVLYLPSDPNADASTAERISDDLTAAIADPDTEILSLLFPTLTSEDGADQVARVMLQVRGVVLEWQASVPGGTVVALRAPIDQHGTVAWLMGFGPFDRLPLTRRSPIAEIAIRTKVKGSSIFWRLNQDRGVAHLADVDLGLPDEHMEARWNGTRRRTSTMLDGVTSLATAAKGTFLLSAPVDLSDFE